MDGQCGKLVTAIGHQFITLTVDICVQHGGREALRRAGLSAAAKTCYVRLFFFSMKPKTGWDKRYQNDLFCVEWYVKTSLKILDHPVFGNEQIENSCCTIQRNIGYCRRKQKATSEQTPQTSFPAAAIKSNGCSLREPY